MLGTVQLFILKLRRLFRVHDFFDRLEAPQAAANTLLGIQLSGGRVCMARCAPCVRRAPTFLFSLLDCSSEFQASGNLARRAIR
jgi:hypothetical protein